MQNQSIICFANDWESDPTSKHQIMKILSRSNRVLWVNSISMRKPSLSTSDVNRIFLKLKGWLQGLQKVHDNLYHFTPIVLPFPSSPLARSLNRYVLMVSLKYYMKKLNMRDVQFWTFLPNVVELVGGLQEKFLLYYCVDEWSKFSFMDGRSMREMEINLLKLADLVITSAEHLYRDKAQFNPNTHLMPHGVDYKYFSKCIHNSVPIADRMSSIRKPIIGFFGLIHEWIDLDLIEKLATENSEWSIVMIGRWSVNIDRFNAYDNVHFLGQKPYEELLSYCKAFDVGLIPFHVNDLTVNVNPIKLREYLAAGIPVVSTALPEVEKYSDIVAIARDAKEFVEKTREILNNDNEDMRLQRSQKMRDESWEMKAEHILHLIDALER